MWKTTTTKTASSAERRTLKQTSKNRAEKRQIIRRICGENRKYNTTVTKIFIAAKLFSRLAMFGLLFVQCNIAGDHSVPGAYGRESDRFVRSEKFECRK